MFDENKADAVSENDVAVTPAKKRVTKKSAAKTSKAEKSLASVGAPVAVKSEKVEEKKPRRESRYLGSVIVAALVLVVIGVGFVYVRDRISKIEAGGTEPTKNLQAQVESLKTELSSLKNKASELEEETDSNKSAVIDIFDKSREIPKTVNVSDWNQFTDEAFGFIFSFPKNWELIKPVVTESDDAAELLYLQPVADAKALNALTVKEDYLDFASLPLEDKKKIFLDMNVIDSRDFADSALIYFIGSETDNREVPTIVFLGADKIYKISFNLTDKKDSHYFDYRKDFEKIAATFALRERAVNEVEPE